MTELRLIKGGESWRDRALCKGKLHLFVGPDNCDRSFYDYAKRLCAICPVIADCREYHRQYPGDEGCWAGEIHQAKPKKPRPPKQENGL